jgi:hypothetical protein
MLGDVHTMKQLIGALLFFLLLPVQSWAAVAFADISAAASGAGSAAPAYSASTANGDLLVICLAHKYPAASTPTTPANWTAPGTNDQGETAATIFYRVASAGCCTSGTETVTITSGNAADAYMVRFTNATGVWDVAAASGGDASRGANWSAAMGTDPGITTNDMVVVCSARSEGSVISASAEALTAASATFGSETERGDQGTSTGDNVGIVVSTHAVTGGPATGNATYTFTSATSSSGGTAILRIRESSAAPAAVGGSSGALGIILQ